MRQPMKVSPMQDAMLSYTAFEGTSILTSGPLGDVVLHVKKRLKTNPEASILVFSDATGKQMDFDLSGTEKAVLERLKIYLPAAPSAAPAAPAGPGRPKLGVVAREVSLLPHQWEWLEVHQEGASAMLRYLVEYGRKNITHTPNKIKETSYSFMSAIAGNLPGYEEALRALFAGDKKKFQQHIATWPKDISTHAQKLAAAVWQ